jgi:hypothetical protein
MNVAVMPRTLLIVAIAAAASLSLGCPPEKPQPVNPNQPFVPVVQTPPEAEPADYNAAFQDPAADPAKPYSNPDRDGDGLTGADDQCPTLPEDSDELQDADGCPDMNDDGDDLPDLADRCDLSPGGDDGCPPAMF